MKRYKVNLQKWVESLSDEQALLLKSELESDTCYETEKIINFIDSKLEDHSKEQFAETAQKAQSLFCDEID